MLFNKVELNFFSRKLKQIKDLAIVFEQNKI